MAMTKKHFIDLADALRPVLGEITPTVLDRIMRFCQDQNPNFDRSRWLGYLRGETGPSGGKVKNPNTALSRV